MRTILRGKPLHVRFAAMVERRGENECWLFRGHIDGDGYGRLYCGKSKPVLAHRYAWSLANGREWPEGLIALHACDVRACCNPRHIQPGTIRENNHDMLRKRRHAFGSRGPKAKLTEAAVLEIRRRRANGETAVALGREFGVSDSLVARVAKGKKWTHVGVSP